MSPIVTLKYSTMLSFFLLANSQKYSNRIRQKASSTRNKKIKKGSYRAVCLVLLSMFTLIFTGKSSIAQPSLTDSTTQFNTFVSSPQKSVHSFIHWQQKGHVIPERYIQPFALFNGEQADKKQLAQQLLKVLDARGLLVVYSEIPLVLLTPFLDYHNTFYSTIFLKCTSVKLDQNGCSPNRLLNKYLSSIELPFLAP